MTIRFNKMIAMGVLVAATTSALAEQSPAPGAAGAKKEPLDETIQGVADADKATLERTIKGLDLMGGVGRPRGGDASSDPPADFGPDPLGDLSNAMSDIHGDLSKYKTDQPVQDKEKDVVATLDKLIAAMKPKSGDGGGNMPGGMGRKRSGIFEGDPRFGDLHDVHNQGRDWAQLPPKERERILQSRTEGYPPGFDQLLQSYYQHLAQEQPAEEKAPAEPATRGGSR